MSSEVKKNSCGLGLPARAAAVAAAMVQAIVAAAISRLGLVASGKITVEEAGELAGKAVCVKLSPRLERAVSREASNAHVSLPCWLSWAASEQLRLARSPLESGEQERMAVEEKKKVEEEAEK